MPFRQSLDYLLISQAAVAAFAAARLLQFHLQKRFSLLVVYLLVTVIYDVDTGILDYFSKAYLWSYLGLTIALCCAAAFSVYEMFALIFQNYPGLRTVGRWALNGALALSISVSVFYLRAPRVYASRISKWLFYELILERSVTFTLAAIIVILMFCLSRYPLDLDRNTYVTSGFFSAILIAHAAVRSLNISAPRLLASYAEYPEIGFAAACFLGWGLMLRPASVRNQDGHPTKNPREAELLQQLESINEILNRSRPR